MVYLQDVDARGTRHLFLVPEGYDENWAVVSMPDGASANLDGLDLTAVCTESLPDGELDGAGYTSFYCPLTGPLHEVVSTGAAPSPLGVMVFGYGETVSYQFAPVPG